MIAVKRRAGKPTVTPSSAWTAASPSPYVRATSTAETSSGAEGASMRGSVARRAAAFVYG